MSTLSGPVEFVSRVRELQFPNTFNPYVDRCRKFDKGRAPDMRAGLLLELLSAACEVDIDAIWIGRDLGHRGGRRTGLALTDDFCFSAHVGRWGLKVDRPTVGPMVRERTATVVWEMLERIRHHVFLWNLFPLHPFPENEPYRNRAHNAVERKAGIELLHWLVSFLQPRRIVAVGKDSAGALREEVVGVDVRSVRHPSHGGERLFREQISSLYGLETSDIRKNLHGQGADA